MILVNGNVLSNFFIFMFVPLWLLPCVIHHQSYPTVCRSWPGHYYNVRMMPFYALSILLGNPSNIILNKCVVALHFLCLVTTVKLYFVILKKQKKGKAHMIPQWFIKTIILIVVILTMYALNIFANVLREKWLYPQSFFVLSQKSNTLWNWMWVLWHFCATLFCTTQDHHVYYSILVAFLIFFSYFKLLLCLSIKWLCENNHNLVYIRLCSLLNEIEDF